MAFTGINYAAGTHVDPSAIDKGSDAQKDQLQSFYWLRKAIIDEQKEQYFIPMASVENMPKHFGKKMVVHQYVPLLDDRNQNDQGIDARGVSSVNGNFYGSSRDVGTIQKNIPQLTENGGRVNRVGFTRLVREGEIQKLGFFYELTQEAMDFDSDAGLKEHLSRELLRGANQMTEALLQIELLNGADSEVYPGGKIAPSGLDATSSTDACVVSYDDIEQLETVLTENRVPFKTTVITGSRFTDTRVVPACRVMHIGIDLLRHIKRIKDPFNNPAFIPAEHYADAGSLMNGEIGKIGSFRLILVPEMLHWDAAGAAVQGGDNKGFKSSNDDASVEKWNVYPMLVVGDDSFTTIGFQTNGKSINFNVITKLPGNDTANYNDPFGETGFSSIKWYAGTLIKRPERIGVIKTLAPMQTQYSEGLRPLLF